MKLVVRSRAWSRTVAVFALPMPIEALVSAAKADDAVAAARLAKRNPVLGEALGEARDAGRAEGRVEGKVETLRQILARRGLVPTAEEDARLGSLRDPEVVDACVMRALQAASVAEVLAPPGESSGRA